MKLRRVAARLSECQYVGLIWINRIELNHQIKMNKSNWTYIKQMYVYIYICVYIYIYIYVYMNTSTPDTCSQLRTPRTLRTCSKTPEHVLCRRGSRNHPSPANKRFWDTWNMFLCSNAKLMFLCSDARNMFVNMVQ